MTAIDPTYPTLGLGEIFRVLRRRWLRVVLTTVVIGGVVLGLTMSETKQYKATAVLLVKTADASTAIQSDPNAQAPDYAARQQMNAQYYLQSSAQKNAVRAQYHGSLNVNDVSVTALTDGSDAIDISVTGPNAKDAADLANLYANVYIKNSNASALNVVKTRWSQLVGSLSNLKAEQKQISAPLAALQVKQISEPGNVSLAAQIQNLEGQISPSLTSIENQITTDQLELQNIWATAELTPEEGASLTTAATVPKSPVSPKPVRNGAIGFVLGLGLGIAFALGKEFIHQSPSEVIDLDHPSAPSTVGVSPVTEPVAVIDSQFEPDEEEEPAFAARRATRRDEVTGGLPSHTRRGGLMAGDTASA